MGNSIMYLHSSISARCYGTFQTSNMICQSTFSSFSLNSFTQHMTIKFQNFDDEIWLKGRGFLTYMAYIHLGLSDGNANRKSFNKYENFLAIN